jgi:hypothetical protein
MQDLESLDAAARELAEALGGLELAPVPTSQSQLWYRAGYEAGGRRARTWRAVAASVALVGTMAVLYGRYEMHPPGRLSDEARPVVVTTKQPERPTEVQNVPAFSASQLQLRDAMLQSGLKALPLPATSTSDRLLNTRQFLEDQKG